MIALASALTILLNFGPIELVDTSLGTPLQTWRWIGISVCIGVLILCSIRKDETNWTKAVKVVTAVVLSALSLVIIAFAGFASGMCLWSERETLYIHKEDLGRRIVVRDFGCGATDSSPPIKRVFEVKKLNAWFLYSSKIDTTLMDHTQWKSVRSTP